MKSVPTEFKSGGLHEKHVVASWNVTEAEESVQELLPQSWRRP